MPPGTRSIPGLGTTGWGRAGPPSSPHPSRRPPGALHAAYMPVERPGVGRAENWWGWLARPSWSRDWSLAGPQRETSYRKQGLLPVSSPSLRHPWQDPDPLTPPHVHAPRPPLEAPAPPSTGDLDSHQSWAADIPGCLSGRQHGTNDGWGARGVLIYVADTIRKPM